MGIVDTEGISSRMAERALDRKSEELNLGVGPTNNFSNLLKSLSMQLFLLAEGNIHFPDKTFFNT